MLERMLPVRASARRIALALFVQGFFAIGALIVGRTASDALFLAHRPRSQFAVLYVLSSLVVALVGFGSARLLARQRGNARRHRTSMTSALGFAGLFLVWWGVERSGSGWVYPAISVSVEVMGTVVVLQFWTLVNALFDAREAKSLYGFIAAGGTLANILLGFGAARLARVFGANALLPLAAALLLAAAAAGTFALGAGRSRLYGRSFAVPPARATGLHVGPTPQKGDGIRRVLAASPHLRYLAGLVAITFFTTTLVDFQFKVTASQTLAPAELATFFGYFTSFAGVVGATIQLVGTARVLDRAGVIGSLALLPTGLLLGSGSLALLGTLPAATAAKGADVVLRYSVNDPTAQILLLPVGPEIRARAKSVIDGMAKPIAGGAAGVFLLVLGRFTTVEPRYLAVVSLVLAAAWLGVVVALRDPYTRALRETLRRPAIGLEDARRRLREGGVDDLARGLDSADPRDVLGALDIAEDAASPEALAEIGERLDDLLAHSDPLVRIAALEHAARRAAPSFEARLLPCLDAPEAEVRAAALRALAAITRERASARLLGFLDDPAPAVRVAALAALVRHGEASGAARARDVLARLAGDEEAEMRRQAADAIGAAGDPSLRDLLRPLLDDADASVRRAAVLAASRVGGPEIVTALVRRAGDAPTIHEVIDALVALGAETTPAIVAALDDPRLGAGPRAALARVLGRLASPEADRWIAAHLDDPDEELRTTVFRALLREARVDHAIVGRRRLERALRAEVDRARIALERAAILDLPEPGETDAMTARAVVGRALLGGAIADKLLRIESRAFLLLAAMYPDARIGAIHDGIRDATLSDAPLRRANAVELLDNVLPRRLRAHVIPLVDDLPREARLRKLRGEVRAASETSAEALEALGRDENAWVRAAALWHASQLDPAPFPIEPAVARARQDPSPVVRAIVDSFGEPNGLDEGRAEPRSRCYGSAMLSMAGRVLFLKGIDLFSEIPGEELVQVALICTDETRAAGELVFGEGEPGDALYMVVAGRLRVHVGSREIAIIEPRECFGEMAILDASPRSASVTALDATRLLRIARDDFQEILDDKPAIARGVIRVLSRRLREGMR